ncbi:hypothetical protein J3R83DRAFT_1470 [Lanmaoa asiatica]|nr:hypothetical protein J3R83DRAFT_1470 [Lanmaoa asiatica]
MTLDFDFMSGESPPPYSAVVATPLLESLEAPDAELPFSHSDRLAIQILGLVSEGKTLDLRFKDVHDVASADATFEYQETALILYQRFETLVWESRNLAGIALVAVKDFNEIVLDFLSEPDVVVQDRLKELANASKLLQRERNSAANQRSSFDAFIKELEDFHRTIHSELGALIPKRRRLSHSRGTKDTQSLRDSENSTTLQPFVVPRSEPLKGLSTVTASLGAVSRTCMDYALQFERIAERAVFPSCVSFPPEAQVISPAAPNHPERKRLCPPASCAEVAASLPGIINALLHDLRAFVSRVDIFNVVFAELAREQDIFVVRLKDGQSVADQVGLLSCFEGFQRIFFFLLGGMGLCMRRGIDSRSVVCGGTFRACATRWMLTAKEDCHERPLVHWTVIPCASARFSEGRDWTREIDRGNRVRFSCNVSVGNRTDGRWDR